MPGRIARWLKNFDWTLFLSAFLLTVIGLIEIYSIALGQGENVFVYFRKQIVFAAVGFAFLFALSFVNFQFLRNQSLYLYLFAGVFLVAVLFFGQTIRGTKGWFSFGFFNFQPVELAKAAIIFFLARYFGEASLKEKPLKHILITGGGLLIFFLLIALQPDLGSALIIFMVWFMMIVAARFDKK